MSHQTASHQTPQQKRILTWLNDAYAMETEGATTLENHADAAGNYPEVQARLRRHAEQTRRHAERVRGRARRLGGQPSGARDALGTVVGTVRGLATRAAKDTVVKNVLADCASERFEVACYTSLIAAAEQEGDRETAQVCREILQEEEAMSAFLEAQVGNITRQFLAEQADESDATPDQQTQGNQSGPLEKVRQNALPVAGGLAVSAGLGLLLARVLAPDLDKSQSRQETRNLSSEHGGSGYGNMFGGARQSEVNREGYQPPEREDAVAMSEAGETDAEVRLGSHSETSSRGGLGSYREAGSETHQASSNPTADEINARLERHGQINAGDIEVTVEENGRVTLEGKVDSEETKQLVRDTIKGILGISQIRNRLEVVPQAEA